MNNILISSVVRARWPDTDVSAPQASARRLVGGIVKSRGAGRAQSLIYPSLIVPLMRTNPGSQCGYTSLKRAHLTAGPSHRQWLVGHQVRAWCSVSLSGRALLDHFSLSRFDSSQRLPELGLYRPYSQIHGRQITLPSNWPSVG